MDEKETRYWKITKKIQKLEKQVAWLRSIYPIAIDREFNERNIKAINVQIRALYEERRPFESRQGMVHKPVV